MQRRGFLLGGVTLASCIVLGTTWLRLNPINWPTEFGKHSEWLLGKLTSIFLDGALPTVSQQRQRTIRHITQQFYTYFPQLGEETQQQILWLLTLLDSRIGLLVMSESVTPIMLKSPAELNAMIEGWRVHDWRILNQAYHSLRELLMLSFYGSPENWIRLDYVKPHLLIQDTAI